MTTPTPEALAKAEQIVSELLHSHDTEQDIKIIALALTEQAREEERARLAYELAVRSHALVYIAANADPACPACRGHVAAAVAALDGPVPAPDTAPRDRACEAYLARLCMAHPERERSAFEHGWDAAMIEPVEPEACRVPEKRGLHVGYPRQGGRAPDGGLPPRTP